MGACSTKEPTEDKVRASPAKSTASSADGARKLETETDEDFRETLRAVLHLILSRLTTALEFEGQGYSDIAQKREKANYMELVQAEVFEKLIRNLWAVEGADLSVDTPEDDINYAAHKFQKLVDAMQTAEWKESALPKKELANSVQAAVAACKAECFKTIDACEHSDLKLHLMYFMACMDVTKGKIAQTPGLLFWQMDTLIATQTAGA
jgi:hypothetical protein